MSDNEQKSWLEKLLEILFSDKEGRGVYYGELSEASEEKVKQFLDEVIKNSENMGIGEENAKEGKKFISENESIIEKDLKKRRIDGMIKRSLREGGKEFVGTVNFKEGLSGKNATEYTKEKVRHMQARMIRLDNVVSRAGEVLQQKVNAVSDLLEVQEKINTARKKLGDDKMNSSQKKALESSTKKWYEELKNKGYIKSKKFLDSKEEDIEKSIKHYQAQIAIMTGEIVALEENELKLRPATSNELSDLGVKEGSSYTLTKGVGKKKKLVFGEKNKGGLTAYKEEKSQKIFSTDKKLRDALSIVGVEKGKPATTVPRARPIVNVVEK